MRVLVTGSSGHLGDALMRLLWARGLDPVGLDLVAGPNTQIVGSICDADRVAGVAKGVDAILHTATLHKPHVATHSRQSFVDTNITGTLSVLEAALKNDIPRVVFTSTTSAFGAALTPPANAPAIWIDRITSAIPKNIYGATKTAAEDLCHLYHRRFGLNVIVLRTARFFPEPDDNPSLRGTFDDQNAKANEFAFRRVDIEDAASAHIAAMIKAPDLGFARYVISATTPFQRSDCARLRKDAPGLLQVRVPDMARIYAKAGYRMFPTIDRVYDNSAARADLNWQPGYDFATVLQQIEAGQLIGSDLTRQVGIKGYHGQAFADGLYPTD